VTSEALLAEYIATYNRADFEGLATFYTADVHLVIGNGVTLVGSRAIVDFYSAMVGKASRTIEVLQCIAEGDLIAAELESEFLALENFPDFPSGAMSKGDRLYINSFALYERRQDRFTRIRTAVFRRDWRKRRCQSKSTPSCGSG
jgi:hypothetical protein